MRRPRRPRLKGLPFNRMIPNILTLLALCAGMTAILFGLQNRWEQAVLAILVAAILDGLDGRVARILKGTSKFGAELDSLSDFICFGVAPAVMLYLWTMQDLGRLGWVLVLLFSVSCALRLARFNTNLDEPELPPWAYNFFSGVPSPAGAGLVILPIILSLQFGDGVLRQPQVVAVFLVVVSALLVSRIPTFALKKFKVPNPWILPTMLFVGLFAAMLVAEPWLTMATALIAYMVSIPFSVRAFRALRRKAEALQRGAEGDATGAAEDPPAD
ncbi:MAG: CDP-diacylglycerol--serine O-phosphatidyltransferase [Rhodospirillales bacterium]